MHTLTKFNYVIFASFAAVLLFVSNSHAMEVKPEIGFQQNHPVSGAENDPNGVYHSRLQREALNDKFLPNNQVTKAVPGVDSVGLNFSFKVD